MVQHSVALSLRTSCTVKLWKFPFDSQKCTISFGMSTASNYIGIDVRPPEYDMDAAAVYQESSEWRNVDISIKRDDVRFFFKNSNMTIDKAEITIKMERNPTFYIIYLLIPSVFTAFVSVLVFLLPPDSGERIGLSVTILLSYSVFLLMVSEFTPRGGTDTAVLGNEVCQT